MIRNFAIAAAAVAALGTASLTVTATPAAAKGGFHKHHGHHGHHKNKHWYGGYGFYGASYAYVDGCLRPAWVDTPWGPRRRLINVCY